MPTVPIQPCSRFIHSMTSVTDPIVGRPPRLGASIALVLGAFLLVGLTLPLAGAGRIGLAAAAGAFACYGLGALLIWLKLDRLGRARFGAANLITVLRGALIALLPAFIIEGREPDAVLGWAILAGGTFALLLDGVDGRLARHLDEATGFGARFDMEVDAAFVLLLSVLVWTAGRAGAWVLLSGLMRYLWLAAALAFPLLNRSLPPSFLRKAICVLQLMLLLAALVPGLAAPWPAHLAASGLGLLILSFGRDLVWLISGGGMAPASRAPYLEDSGCV